MTMNVRHGMCGAERRGGWTASTGAEAAIPRTIAAQIKNQVRVE